MLQKTKILLGALVALSFPAALSSGTIYADGYFHKYVEAPPHLTCEVLSDMDTKQREVIYEAFEIGKEEDLGLTLAAIAWQESNAGLYTVNAKTHSYGVFQIRLATALSRMGLSNEDSFRKNAVASRLVNDMEFAAKHAIEEIRYWQKVRGKNNWNDVLASYNGGWKGPNIGEAQKYANAVKNKIKKLQTCMG